MPQKLLGESASPLFERVHALSGGAQNGGVFVVKKRANGKFYVEKTFVQDHIRNHSARREAEYLRKCRHRHITYLEYEASCERSGTRAGPGYFSVYIEFCPLGSLQDLINAHWKAGEKIGEVFVWQMFIQVADAVRYLHYGPAAGDEHEFEVQMGKGTLAWHKIIHRDIKPENIFLAWYRGEIIAKLSDLGGAVSEADSSVNGIPNNMRERVHEEVLRTPIFQSPEFAADRTAYGEKSDVFALGGSIISLCRLSLNNRNGTWLPWKDKKPNKMLGKSYSTPLSYACYVSVLDDEEIRPDAVKLWLRLREEFATNPEIDTSRTRLLLPNGSAEWYPVLETTVPPLARDELSSPKREHGHRRRERFESSPPAKKKNRKKGKEKRGKKERQRRRYESDSEWESDERSPSPRPRRRKRHGQR